MPEGVRAGVFESSVGVGDADMVTCWSHVENCGSECREVTSASGCNEGCTFVPGSVVVPFFLGCVVGGCPDDGECFEVDFGVIR